MNRASLKLLPDCLVLKSVVSAYFSIFSLQQLLYEISHEVLLDYTVTYVRLIP